MMHFSIGDRVIIRHGQHKGQRAEIVAVQPAKVYKVKLSDGSFLFYSGGGLRRENAVGSERNILSRLQGATGN
jgi:hypothetical protein